MESGYTPAVHASFPGHNICLKKNALKISGKNTEVVLYIYIISTYVI